MHTSQSAWRPSVIVPSMPKLRPNVGPETPRSTYRGTVERMRVLRSPLSAWSLITRQRTEANSSVSPDFSTMASRNGRPFNRTGSAKGCTCTRPPRRSMRACTGAMPGCVNTTSASAAAPIDVTPSGSMKGACSPPAKIRCIDDPCTVKAVTSAAYPLLQCCACWPEKSVTDALLPLSVCVAIGLIWYAAMRARERAIAHAQKLCAQCGAQMLDQSVVLHGLRPLLRGGRPRLLRSYRFDLSYSGNDRHRASLTLAGERLINYSLPARDDSLMATHTPRTDPVRVSSAPSITGNIASGGNVVPITRGRRTLH